MPKARHLKEIQDDAIAMRKQLWNLIDEAFRRGCEYQAAEEPQFAPPAVKDDKYRDAYYAIATDGTWNPKWMLAFSGPRGSRYFDVPPEHVRHILAYLSEMNR